MQYGAPGRPRVRREARRSGRGPQHGAAAAVGPVDGSQRDEEADVDVAQDAGHGELCEGRERLHAAQREQHGGGHEQQHREAVDQRGRQTQGLQDQGEAVGQDHREGDAADARLRDAGDHGQPLRLRGHELRPGLLVRRLAAPLAGVGDEDEAVGAQQAEDQREEERGEQRLGAPAEGRNARRQRQHARAHDVLHEVDGGLRHRAQLLLGPARRRGAGPRPRRGAPWAKVPRRRRARAPRAWGECTASLSVMPGAACAVHAEHPLRGREGPARPQPGSQQREQAAAPVPSPRRHGGWSPPARSTGAT
mmetsp:Transcript_97189/g.299582  ORF Transcript_97189/g.299582 Transcript_97189/m.299582 type:complete len:307 (-) Transcript_97189:21-941(-)